MVASILLSCLLLAAGGAADLADAERKRSLWLAEGDVLQRHALTANDHVHADTLSHNVTVGDSILDINSKSDDSQALDLLNKVVAFVKRSGDTTLNEDSIPSYSLGEHNAVEQDASTVEEVTFFDNALEMEPPPRGVCHPYMYANTKLTILIGRR
jgi:hypothetical protein